MFEYVKLEQSYDIAPQIFYACASKADLFQEPWPNITFYVINNMASAKVDYVKLNHCQQLIS